jgi:hypothetical protein
LPHLLGDTAFDSALTFDPADCKSPTMNLPAIPRCPGSGLEDFNLEINTLIEAAASQYDNLPQASTVVNVVQEYIIDRFENMVVEQGVSVESFRATIKTPGHSFNAPLSAHQRAHRVQLFSQTEAAKDLAEAAKRTRNNRLALLKEHNSLFLSVIDISYLALSRQPIMISAVNPNNSEQTACCYD